MGQARIKQSVPSGTSSQRGLGVSPRLGRAAGFNAKARGVSKVLAHIWRWDGVARARARLGARGEVPQGAGPRAILGRCGFRASVFERSTFLAMFTRG